MRVSFILFHLLSLTVHATEIHLPEETMDTLFPELSLGDIGASTSQLHFRADRPSLPNRPNTSPRQRIIERRISSQNLLLKSKKLASPPLNSVQTLLRAITRIRPSAFASKPAIEVKSARPPSHTKPRVIDAMRYIDTSLPFSRVDKVSYTARMIIELKEGVSEKSILFQKQFHLSREIARSGSGIVYLGINKQTIEKVLFL